MFSFESQRNSNSERMVFVLGNFTKSPSLYRRSSSSIIYSCMDTPVVVFIILSGLGRFGLSKTKFLSRSHVFRTPFVPSLTGLRLVVRTAPGCLCTSTYEIASVSHVHMLFSLRTLPLTNITMRVCSWCCIFKMPHIWMCVGILDKEQDLVGSTTVRYLKQWKISKFSFYNKQYNIPIRKDQAR